MSLNDCLFPPWFFLIEEDKVGENGHSADSDEGCRANVEKRREERAEVNVYETAEAYEESDKLQDETHRALVKEAEICEHQMSTKVSMNSWRFVKLEDRDRKYHEHCLSLSKYYEEHKHEFTEEMHTRLKEMREKLDAWYLNWSKEDKVGENGHSADSDEGCRANVEKRREERAEVNMYETAEAHEELDKLQDETHRALLKEVEIFEHQMSTKVSYMDSWRSAKLEATEKKYHGHCLSLSKYYEDHKDEFTEEMFTILKEKRKKLDAWYLNEQRKFLWNSSDGNKTPKKNPYPAPEKTFPIMDLKFENGKVVLNEKVPTWDTCTCKKKPQN